MPHWGSFLKYLQGLVSQPVLQFPKILLISPPPSTFLCDRPGKRHIKFSIISKKCNVCSYACYSLRLILKRDPSQWNTFQCIASIKIIVLIVQVWRNKYLLLNPFSIHVLLKLSLFQWTLEALCEMYSSDLLIHSWSLKRERGKTKWTQAYRNQLHAGSATDTHLTSQHHLVFVVPLSTKCRYKFFFFPLSVLV